MRVLNAPFYMVDLLVLVRVCGCVCCLWYFVDECFAAPSDRNLVYGWTIIYQNEIELDGCTQHFCQYDDMTIA